MKPYENLASTYPATGSGFCPPTIKSESVGTCPPGCFCSFTETSLEKFHFRPGPPKAFSFDFREDSFSQRGVFTGRAWAAWSFWEAALAVTTGDLGMDFNPSALAKVFPLHNMVRRVDSILRPSSAETALIETPPKRREGRSRLGKWLWERRARLHGFRIIFFPCHGRPQKNSNPKGQNGLLPGSTQSPSEPLAQHPVDEGE